ncbi:GTP-sensing pleiotropic transcriptional regulator CodY [Aminipila luticellarii]|uniref:Global transcriptional regulator CodY n=1 Tax=Aminipila luticellarii TaxID=2507160 RepID=A0A410PW83_9FIRM|nr:GTP-sensing pleiotropic transcriptional regulator CodY [Aminipila luticellarii]QAT43202.1 GTP-sensing pleiotropic transcriptional regulator CodY [Aminipila luticellarii]
MGKDLLSKIRKLNWVLQESATGAFSFDELCNILSDMMDANVYIANLRGKVIGVHYKIKSDSSTITDPETGIEKFPNEYNEALLKVTSTEANLKAEDALEIFKYDYDTYDKLHTIIPILGGGQRWGTLICTRYEPEFSNEDLVLGEYGATVVGLEIQRRKTLEFEEEERMRSIVQMAIGTLSYSEIEAVQQIFAELNGNEGLLVASKIADRSGITRSVIVNALRKLESAGVIESRSLGMKGTHIKILNPKFYEELEKLDM